MSLLKRDNQEDSSKATQEANTSEEVTKVNSSNRSGRPTRTNSAVGGKSDILTVNGERDPNFNYRFVNVEGSRIEEMQGYGYEIVQDSDVSIGTHNEKHSGTSHEVVVDRKTGDKAVLMRQPIEFHEEDRVARAKKIAESEDGIRRNLDNASEGTYVKKLEITRDGI